VDFGSIRTKISGHNPQVFPKSADKEANKQTQAVKNKTLPAFVWGVNKSETLDFCLK